MKANVGGIDRIIRGILGVGAVIVVLTVTYGVITYFLFVLAAFMIITSLIGVCPLYKQFNKSTNKYGVGTRGRRTGLILGVVFSFVIMAGGIPAARLAFLSFEVDEPALFWLTVAGVSSIFIGSIVVAVKYW